MRGGYFFFLFWYGVPMNTQGWSPLGWIGWIFLLSKELSRVFSQHHSSKASILRCSAFFTVQLSYPYMTTGKTMALTRWTFVGKVTSLLLNMLFRLVITFLPRSNCLLISWLQSPSAVILEPQKIKAATVSTVSPSICHEVMGPDAMILVFWLWIAFYKTAVSMELSRIEDTFRNVYWTADCVAIEKSTPVWISQWVAGREWITF